MKPRSEQPANKTTKGKVQRRNQALPRENALNGVSGSCKSAPGTKKVFGVASPVSEKPKRNYEWMTPELVAAYIAEKIWKVFPFCDKRGNMIVWEFGIIERIIHTLLHVDTAKNTD